MIMPATSDLPAFHDMPTHADNIYASVSGVGMVLSQRFGDMAKICPLVFFCQKLTLAEKNYNICTRC